MNLELFPCSGGMGEGFRRAGIRFQMAIDKDPHAVESYWRNHFHRPIQMDVVDFLRMVRAGWRPPEPIDLLVADPPCTPWSRAGKRLGRQDERDCLDHTAELIALLRPRAYLIGNVPGLQDSTSWHVVQEVIGGLASHGYCVVDYAALDAADYGVPQHRVRPFWFGHLDGPCVRWPAPTHGAPTTQLAIGAAALLAWVTCRQALQHLPIEELGRPVRMRIREKGEDGTRHGGDVTRCSAPDKPATTVVAKDGRKGGQILIPVGRELLAHEKHPMCELDEPAKTVTAHLGATGAIQGGSALFVGEAVEHQHHEGATLVAQPLRGNSSHKGPNAVVLSARAAAILQGFPDGECEGKTGRCPEAGCHPGKVCPVCGDVRRWHFTGATKKAVWSQLGQAMPPGLAEPVARAIAEQMRAARAEVAA